MKCQDVNTHGSVEQPVHVVIRRHGLHIAQRKTNAAEKESGENGRRTLINARLQAVRHLSFIKPIW